MEKINVKSQNLLEGNPFWVILSFSTFYILGDFLQQLYNAVDSIVLGRFVSTDALAAIGVATPIMNLVMNVIIGFTIGSSIVFARWFGKGDNNMLKRSISTALIIGISFTIVLSILSIALCKPFLKLLNTPDEIMQDTLIYLYIVFAANIFTFLYNFYCYAIRAIGNSFTPLVFLIVSTILNLVLDLLFVLVFKLGIEGAAIATLIAQAFSAFAIIIYTNKKISEIKLSIKEITFDKTQAKDILSYSSSVALQQTFVYAARIAVQGLINTFGKTVIAGTNIGEKLNALYQTPLRGYANASTTYFSQNLGAKKFDRIKGGYKSINIVAFINTAIFMVIGMVFAEPIVKLFVDSSAIDVIEVGKKSIFYMASGYLFASFIVLNQSLIRSLGKLKVFVILTITTIMCRVVFSYAFAGLLKEYAIYLAIPVSWVVGGTLNIIFGYLSYKKEVKPFINIPPLVKDEN